MPRAGPRSQLNRTFPAIGPPHIPQTIGPLRRRAGTVTFAFFAGWVTTVPSGRVMVTSEAGGTS
ncbi:hypothetical protein ACFC5T_40415 [Streptomyces sp. NPDC055961]|uniref:hypothetical protein n=1 Tax=Streptomyces sp. NPDC055961 TaxID=3345666 RepID=UPI0035DB6453